MNDYTNKYYIEIVQRLSNGQSLNYYSKDKVAINDLKYYLFRCGYKPFIIDNYPNLLENKEALLEALFYEMNLFDMYDLNWDSLSEGLEKQISNVTHDHLILFSNRNKLKKIESEIEVLTEVVNEVNSNTTFKYKIVIGE